MKVSVDHRAHRLVGDQLDVFEKGSCGGGRSSVIDEHRVPVVDDHHVIAANAAGSVIDAIGNLFELIRLALNDGKVVRGSGVESSAIAIPNMAMIFIAELLHSAVVYNRALGLHLLGC